MDYINDKIDENSLEKAYHDYNHAKVANIFRTIPSTFSSVRALAAQDSDPFEELSKMFGIQNKAPPSVSLVSLPSNTSEWDFKNFNDIETLCSFISLTSATLLYKNDPQGWDINVPEQLLDFNKKSANANFLMITKYLPGVLRRESADTYNYSKTVAFAELHLEFLTELFAKYKLPQSTLDKLDTILTQIAKQLSTVKATWEKVKTEYVFVIFFYRFEDVEGLTFKIPKLHLFYLRIASESLTLSIGKAEVGSVKFSMDYDEYVFSMNVSQMDKYRETILNLNNEMTGGKLSELKDFLKPMAV